MNEFTPIAFDSTWMYGAIAVSFFAGCVYRLCTLLGRDSLAGDAGDTDTEVLNQRYNQEMRHIRQLQNELIQVRQAVEQRNITAPPTAASMVVPAMPATVTPMTVLTPGTPP